MAGEQDGSIAPQIIQKLSKGDLLHGIESDRRFIKHQERWIGDQGSREAGSLPEPTAQGTNQSVPNVSQTTGIDCPPDPSSQIGSTESRKSSSESQVFLDPEFWVEGIGFGKVPNLATNPQRISNRIDSSH